MIDVGRDTMIKTIPCGTDPEQVTLSPDGRVVYVTNEETARSTAVDVNTGATLWSTAVGTEPDGIAVTPDGKRVYVAAETGNVVTVLDAAKGTVIASVAIPGGPRFVEVDPRGVMNVANMTITRTIAVDSDRGASLSRPTRRRCTRQTVDPIRSP